MKDLKWELEKQRDAALAEIERLKGELEKAQAACAEMRSVLQGWRDYNQADVPRTGEAMEEAGEWFTRLWTDMDKALSSDCGSALLKELDTLKKALIVANGLLKESQTREKRLKEWLEKEIKTCETTVYRKDLALDTRRAAYENVQNFLKSEGWV